MINDVQIHTNGAFSRNELLDMPIRDFLEIKEMLQENIDKQKQQMNQRKGKITTQLQYRRAKAHRQTHFISFDISLFD